MAGGKIFHCLKINFFCLKVLGVWPGRHKSKFYNYYSFIYITTTLFVYNILLTLNLIYTPRTIELLLREVFFYFTEIVVMCKVAMVFFLRKTMIESIDLLDSSILNGHGLGNKNTEKLTATYLKFWKYYALSSNIAYFTQVLPLLFTNNSRGEFPICKYYFLSEEMRHKYYYFWYIYQSIGMYGHMMYNVNIDSFMSGMIFFGIGQFKLLRTRLENLGKSSDVSIQSDEESIDMHKINQCLKQYEVLLRYCKKLQKLLSAVMFFQFGVSSIIICVVLCALTILHLKTEMYVFMVFYLVEMTTQIFVPGFLGTQLTIEGQEISNAVYSSEWIGTSEPYKRSVKLLMERTKKPITLNGLKMFPISLGTFTSIMKTAYSFFTLLRNVRE